MDRHGRINVLVNNAGRALVGGVEETSDRELRDLMEVHFFGPAALTRAVLPHMRQQQSGAIVQISSMGGRTPLRLPLGNDSADAIAASLDTTRAELAAWEHVTRGTGFGQ